MQFSLLFFSDANSEGSEATAAYKRVMEMTEFADRNGFEAVWIPERHFTKVGGIYPNPAVLAAALATTTKNIRIRAGSVVVTLHHPLSTVEDWSMVDRLSNGRVDLALASGWNVDDFVLSPETYESRREFWLKRISMIQSLWRGEPQAFRNGNDVLTKVKTYPRPEKTDLNIWLTVTRKEESFRIAGESGYNVLTMMSGITTSQLSQNITTYRTARAKAGYDPSSGVVTLMLHTYIHKNANVVRERVKGPLLDYLKTTARTHLDGGAISLSKEASEADLQRIAEYSFERYFNGGALFGDLSMAKKIVSEFQESGVTEIAAMMDFGLAFDHVIESLLYLRDLKDSFY